MSQLTSVVTALDADQYDGETLLEGMSATDSIGNASMTDVLVTYKVKKDDWVITLGATPERVLVLTNDEYNIFNYIIENSLPMEYFHYTGVAGSITDGMNWNTALSCYEVLTSTASYLVTAGDYVLFVNDGYAHEISSLFFNQEFLIVIPATVYTYLTVA